MLVGIKIYHKVHKGHQVRNLNNFLFIFVFLCVLCVEGPVLNASNNSAKGICNALIELRQI